MVSIGRNTKVLFVIALAAIAGGVIFFKNAPQEQRNVDSTQASKTLDSSRNAELPKGSNSGDPIVSDTAQGNNTPNYQEGAVVKDWASRNGLLSKEEREDYAHYDEKTLVNLADGGDSKAMQVLSTLYINRGVGEDINRVNAWKYAEKATVYGSLSSIFTLANMALVPDPYIEPGSDQKSSFPKKEPREKLIESLALSKTLELRGDKNLAKVMKDTHLTQFKSIYDTEIALTPAVDAEINARAQAIYDSWVQQRQALGLGDFERMPASLQKLVDSVSR